MARTIGGIVAGILTALVSVWIVDLIGHIVYPLPAELNIGDTAQVGEYLNAMPTGAMIFVALAWFVGAMDGGLVAAMIAQRAWAPWAVAGAVVVAALLNILMIPHPVILQIAAVAAPLLGGFAAVRLAERVRPRAGQAQEAVGDA